jgi:hypothetical protein
LKITRGCGLHYQDVFAGLETGSGRLFKQYMKGEAYRYRPEQ